MTRIPAPKPGMVVQYEYLWARQFRDGMTYGEKIRPCAILAVVEGKDETTVYVSPITHTAPYHPEESIQFSNETSKRLGLDAHPKWLMVNEVNKFTWPGDDLRRVPHREPRTYCYGMLPEQVLLQAREKLKAFNAGKALHFVPRDANAARPPMRSAG